MPIRTSTLLSYRLHPRHRLVNIRHGQQPLLMLERRAQLRV
jgi:hypothetical protein